MSDLKPETLEVPDRVRRQIEKLASRLEAAESERDQWEREYRDHLAVCDTAAYEGAEAVKAKLEAAESALTEALDALDAIDGGEWAIQTDSPEDVRRRAQTLAGHAAARIRVPLLGGRRGQRSVTTPLGSPAPSSHPRRRASDSDSR